MTNEGVEDMPTTSAPTMDITDVLIHLVRHATQNSEDSGANDDAETAILDTDDALIRSPSGDSDDADTVILNMDTLVKSEEEPPVNNNNNYSTPMVSQLRTPKSPKRPPKKRRSSGGGKIPRHAFTGQDDRMMWRFVMNKMRYEKRNHVVPFRRKPAKGLAIWDEFYDKYDAFDGLYENMHSPASLQSRFTRTLFPNMADAALRWEHKIEYLLYSKYDITEEFRLKLEEESGQSVICNEDGVVVRVEPKVDLEDEQDEQNEQEEEAEPEV